MSRLTFQTKRETKRVTEGKKGGMGGGMVEEEGGKGKEQKIFFMSMCVNVCVHP